MELLQTQQLLCNSMVSCAPSEAIESTLVSSLLFGSNPEYVLIVMQSSGPLAITWQLISPLSFELGIIVSKSAC
jgi:hypothetical protein